MEEKQVDLLGLKLQKIYLGENFKLSLDNKLLLYKFIFKPIWTYTDFNNGVLHETPTSIFHNDFSPKSSELLRIVRQIVNKLDKYIISQSVQSHILHPVNCIYCILNQV